MANVGAIFKPSPGASSSNPWKTVYTRWHSQTRRVPFDVSLPGPDVERQLEKLGLRLSTKGAFGGFYYSLRREAGLIKEEMGFRFYVNKCENKPQLFAGERKRSAIYISI